MTADQKVPGMRERTDALADHLTVDAHDGAVYLAVRNAEVRMTCDEARALIDDLCARIAEVER